MKNKINKKEVGERIRFIRLNRGYTIQGFGDLFGASRGNVQAWESGACLPNKRRLQKIAQMANIGVTELLYGNQNNRDQEVAGVLQKKPNKKEVGKRIFSIRKNMNLTLEQFGLILQVGKSNVSVWELGKSLPRREKSIEIAKLGKISVEELLYGKEKEIKDLKIRLLNLPTKERVELILGVLKKTKIEEENEEKKQKKIAAIEKITAL